MSYVVFILFFPILFILLSQFLLYTTDRFKDKTVKEIEDLIKVTKPRVVLFLILTLGFPVLIIPFEFLQLKAIFLIRFIVAFFTIALGGALSTQVFLLANLNKKKKKLLKEQSSDYE